MQRIFTLLILALLPTIHPALAATPGTPASVPKPFEATYEASYSGFEVTATRSLRQRGDQFEFLLTATSWLATLQEASQFRWRAQGRIEPLSYSYQRKVLGSKRWEKQDFDWRAGEVHYSSEKKSQSLPLPANALDKLSYQLQLRYDLINDIRPLSYELIDGHRGKTYEFAIVSNAVIETPAGKLNSVQVERVRDDDNRKTVFWLARDWDYLLVKMQQFEDGELEFEINLASASVGGKPVTGL